MPRYLWLRIGIVVAVIVGSLVLIAPRDWRGQPAPADQPGPRPPGRHPPGPRRGRRQGHRERRSTARPSDLKAGAREEGRSASQVARQGRASVDDPARLAAGDPRRRSRRSPSFVEFDTEVARTRRRAGSCSPSSEKVVTELPDLAVRQGLETIRNRVDQFGVAEPTIQQQGDNRILVQLPGRRRIPSAPRRSSARPRCSSSSCVDDQADPERALRRARPPEGRRDPLPAARGQGDQGTSARSRTSSRRRYAADRRAISDRRASRIDPNAGRAVRLRRVQRVRAPRIFGEVDRGERRASGWPSSSTATSTPRPRSASASPSGRAQITGRFTRRGGHAISPSCCGPGRCPAPVQVLEERTVGPLARAPTRSARASSPSAAAALAVFVFMLVYYRLSGADRRRGARASTSLILLAAMAGFHATLTLPGIAGIVLTIGMAVDTNILIFERIREELRLGQDGAGGDRRGLRARVPTVIDTHVTVLVSGRHPVPVRDRAGEGLRGVARRSASWPACSPPSSSPGCSST